MQHWRRETITTLISNDYHNGFIVWSVCMIAWQMFWDVPKEGLGQICRLSQVSVQCGVTWELDGLSSCRISGLVSATNAPLSYRGHGEPQCKSRQNKSRLLQYIRWLFLKARSMATCLFAFLLSSILWIKCFVVWSISHTLNGRESNANIFLLIAVNVLSQSTHYF